MYIQERRCASTGKVRYSTLEEAKGGARGLARYQNKHAVLARNMYAYTCAHCGDLHITKRASFKGAKLHPVFYAAPEAVQRWAFPERCVDVTPLLRVHEAACERLRLSLAA